MIVGAAETHGPAHGHLGQGMSMTKTIRYRLSTLDYSINVHVPLRTSSSELRVLNEMAMASSRRSFEKRWTKFRVQTQLKVPNEMVMAI